MIKGRQKSFGQRLHDVIQTHAGGVVRRFAQAIGVNHQAVHNWLSEESLPNAKALVSLWNVYRVDPLWLLTGEQSIHGPVVLRVAPASEAYAQTEDALEGDLERERFVPIPLLSKEKAAGTPREISANDIEDFVVIHTDWAPRPEMLTCVRVEDDAMQPVLAKGSIVAVDHGKRDPKRLNGKLCAFRVPGGVAVRWCHFRDIDYVVGYPENRAAIKRGAMVISTGEEAADCLVGQVVWWWGRSA
ncbi:MAG: S24 family peptidase [Candidatus Lernaella stagnicola]|nr:S24 family peptidase [Candidatus Lernaella stagnicola]